jgi:uncharacterized paraquat-inducible protein A
MAVKRARVKKTGKATSRVCPNCALIVREPVECCPRCNTRMAVEHDENLVDKTSADSFPASDPPPY